MTIFLAGYFVTLFTVAPFTKRLSATTGTFMAYSLIAIPTIIALAYLFRTIQKIRRYGIPESFKGWRYTFTIIGFGVLLLGALAVVLPIVSSKSASGVSGVPLGISVIFSFLLVLPAMTTSR